MVLNCKTKMTVFGQEKGRAIYLPVALWQDSNFPFKLKEPLDISVVGSNGKTHIIITKSEKQESNN